MTTNQHTPGPWYVERVTKPITGEPGNLFIHGANAMVQSPIADTSAMANAALIAAAPDLLAALVDVLPDLEHYVSTHGPGPDRRLDAARAAIAKAKGGAA